MSFINEKTIYEKAVAEIKANNRVEFEINIIEPQDENKYATEFNYTYSNVFNNAVNDLLADGYRVCTYDGVDENTDIEYAGFVSGIKE